MLVTKLAEEEESRSIEYPKGPRIVLRLKITFMAMTVQNPRSWKSDSLAWWSSVTFVMKTGCRAMPPSVAQLAVAGGCVGEIPEP